MRRELADFGDKIESILLVLSDNQVPFDGGFKKADSLGDRIVGIEVQNRPTKKQALDFVSARPFNSSCIGLVMQRRIALCGTKSNAAC
jgi:hypothetical protein